MIKKTETEIMKNWHSYDDPIVSIICITYNHESYIEEAIDSILMQETNFPFELNIRDDCSTDQTTAIIKKYVKEFPNIIKPIFELENQYSKGVNPFIPVYKKARGKYVALIEGDDYWRDELKLQKQVDFLEKHNEYILSYHNAIIVDEQNQEVSKVKNISPADYNQDDMLCGKVLILTNTVMFRKVKITFPEDMGKILNGDTILWHLLGHYGKSKYQKEIKYSAYRLHDGGIWSSLGKLTQFKKGIEIQRYLRILLKDNSRLTRRLTRSIDYTFAKWLYESIFSSDFKLFKNIFQILKEDKEVHIIKVFMLMFKVFLKKMKFKYFRKKNEI